MSERDPGVERTVRSWMDPAVALFDRLGVSPTALTILGLLLNLAAAAVVWTGRLRIGAAAFLFASLFDMVDGGVARRRGAESRLGAFLDSTFDRISETALLCALLHDVLTHGYGPWWLPEATLVALAGSLAVSYTRARAEGLGLECKVGWLERPERVVLLVIGMAAGRLVLGYVLFALAVLSWVTVAQRIVHVWRKLSDSA
jgi:CDP-diacylglycerol--glycerol-3-phosphate 3-phosphatidyltransferase